MEATMSMVSVNELKNLLFSVAENKTPVCIRVRTIGHLWHPNFLRVLQTGKDKPTLFHDETKKEVVSIVDISTVIQFELDRAVYPFEPHFHYQVFIDN